MSGPVSVARQAAATPRGTGRWRARLARLLKPRSVVFIGGGGLADAIDYCRACGFAGAIHVVSPKRAEIAGIATRASLADLPEVPDAAYVAIRSERVEQTLAALASMGVAGAVCNSSGFAEMEAGGAERHAAFLRAAGDMPVVGPNCPGIANYLDGVALMMGHFGDHAGTAGGVAVISNGGAYLSDTGCADRSLPIAYQLGLGNQASVTVADLLDLVLDDERVSAVNLYVESLREVDRLAAAALRAARRGLPVVVVKGGRGSAGQRAAQSHTASLAGDAAVASALFRRLGFVEARNPVEAVETLKMLVHTRRPAGRRVALATSSGSYAVLGGDAAEAAGLQVPPLDATRRALIDPLLPPYVRAANPLDVSDGQYASPEVHTRIADAFLSQDVDIAAQVMCFPPAGGWDPSSWRVASGCFARAAAARGLPAAFVSTLPEALPRDAREAMIAAGMAPLMGIDHGFQAIGNAARWVEMNTRILAGEAAAVTLPPPPAAGAGVSRALDEAQAKDLLAAAGVDVPRGRRIAARAAPGRLGLRFPLALKALSPRLAHKSEVGAVRLGIESDEALSSALEAMRRRLAGALPAPGVTGFLVEEMVPGTVAELLVGVRRVAGIGFALTLGIGGVATELQRDTASVLLPSPRSVLAEALASLRLYPLLAGWRGAPAADLAGALAAVEAIAEFALAHADTLLELEVNPLMVPAQGVAVAADAVLQLCEPP